MGSICYLCGNPILGAISQDHAVPVALIEREQPKVKGYDYAGKLPTHAECNNRFGPETYTAKALDLLKVLNDPECILKLEHRDDPNIRIMAINSDCLPSFTEGDLRFFKFIDAREFEQTQWSSPSFFSGKSRAHPTRDALNVALSVLAKSAAALLVKRFLQCLPERWKIFSFPYTGSLETLDFDSMLGDTKPFEVGIKVWIKPLDTGDWFAIYKARGVLLFTVFCFSKQDVIDRIGSIFADTDRFCFEGGNLNEMLVKGWTKV